MTHDQDLPPGMAFSDVLRSGLVQIFRNDRNKKFGAQDQHVFMQGWNRISELPQAFYRAAKAEEDHARHTPFAWHPRFGYLSPFPEHCGTGLLIQAELHLEGLNLIGDIPPVQSALAALRMEMLGLSYDGIRDAGHFYRIGNKEALGMAASDLMERLMRVFQDLVRQELNARTVLIDEHPLVFADSVARALAVLKSARLLSQWELFDLLSPIRLAASLGCLHGITVDAVDRLMQAQTVKPNFAPPQTPDEEKKRDARDARLAAQINRRFARVTFREPSASGD